jgi:hypothetical protein
MMEPDNELIIVRSLTDSDLGLFAAHRPVLLSKQRALNINAVFARRLLSPELYAAKGTKMPCCILFGDTELHSERHIGKVGKNWRLGGDKVDGNDFASLDSKDFALIRSVAHNDGSSLITILFLSKIRERQKHADVGRLVEPVMKKSMELYMAGSAGFEELAALFPQAKPGKPNTARRPLVKER